MEPLLEVQLSTTPSAAVVTASGEVDMTTAGLLAERLDQALGSVPQPRAVIVDLTGVGFLGAVGVAALMGARGKCGRRGVPLFVVAPTRHTRRTLTICDLDSELHVVARSPLTSAAGLTRALEDRAVEDTAVGILMADGQVEHHRARAELVERARCDDVSVRESASEVVARVPGRAPAETSTMVIDLVAAAWETEPAEHRSQISDLASALTRQGHQVTVHVRRTSEEPVPDRTGAGFDVVRLPAGPPTPLSAAALLPHLDDFASALDRYWAQRTPDVVHLHSWQSGLALRRAAIPSAQSLHGLEAFKDVPRSSKVAELERLAVLAADRVIAASTEEVFTLARLGVPRTRMTLVPWGVDTATFSPDGPVAPRRNAPRVIALGEVAPHSGLDTAIEALAAVPDAELLVTGPIRSPVPREDPELARLVRHARKLGVDHRLRFTGRLDRRALPALLRSADVAVCVPTREPAGTGALQAMACGVPVIASAAGALKDVVIDGTTGVLVPPRDPIALGQTLHDLLADPVRREVYKITGVDRARSRYSWDRVAAEVVRAYPTTVDAPRAGSPVKRP